MGNTVQKHQEKDQEEDKIEEQEQPEQEEDSNFTCEICVEPIQSNRKFKNGSFCTHPFCLDCISNYIKVKVEGNTGSIQCPGLNCMHLLEPLSCRSIISKQQFDRWCDLLCDSTVLKVERCYCPYQDCSALVLNECQDRLEKIMCPNCKKHFCFSCKIPWHAGYRCSESQQLRDRNDILFGELLERKKWTRCYNCGQSVERVQGCRVIDCRCGVRFCHECGGQHHSGPCSKHIGRGSFVFCWLLHAFCGLLYVFCFLFLAAILFFSFIIVISLF